MAKKPAAPKRELFQGPEPEPFRQPITETLETNYMPYAMSVIVSRAIPEIDGFKPSHRKLLYTMYKMGLMNGPRTKSANVVGATMRLNPHGDAAIYETMVRLTNGCEALCVPFVDSKGNFGKQYSRDMAYAAPRYTEVRLLPICAEIFGGIDRDAVDMVPNYDNTTTEPLLLPTAFPNILVSPNIGIAVGMASNICPFNLSEVCDATMARIRDPRADPAAHMLAPDFPGGGQILYAKSDMDSVFRQGRGSVRVRATYTYDKKAGVIEINQIPYTTAVEPILDKIIALMKEGKLKEITGVPRDETDLHGLKLTLDLRNGTDPDKLMAKLFKMTPLEDSFGCNFNLLIAGTPRVMGVGEILDEWIAWRSDCIRREVFFEMNKKKEKLHLLKGLKKILLDIDKAVAIVRGTENDADVVPNLMIGFGIDRVQAEFVADIRLRWLNRQYILDRVSEIESLQQQIDDAQDILNNRARVGKLICEQLAAIKKKYGQPRRSEIIYEEEVFADEEEDETDDSPVTLFLTREGYFKKITPQSLRMYAEQKLKEGDEMMQVVEATNAVDLLFFTEGGDVYKAHAADFENTKASAMGDFIPAKLGTEGCRPLFMAVTGDYSGEMLFFFENGKAARVPMNAYETKTNRRCLKGGFYGKEPLCAAFQVGKEGKELLLASSAGKYLLVNSLQIPLKATRASQGVQVMTLRAKGKVDRVCEYQEGMLTNAHRLRAKNLPAAGGTPAKDEKDPMQLML